MNWTKLMAVFLLFKDGFYLFFILLGSICSRRILKYYWNKYKVFNTPMNAFNLCVNWLYYKKDKYDMNIASLYMMFLRQIYKQCIKRQKNDNGSWVDTLGYDTDYSIFPLGHGEKSVIVLLRSGMELTDDEIIANRWHMNAWDLPFQSYEAKSNLNVAREHSPLLTLIQTADGLSSALIERT